MLDAEVTWGWSAARNSANSRKVVSIVSTLPGRNDNLIWSR
jgi:hypothetical protein